MHERAFTNARSFQTLIGAVNSAPSIHTHHVYVYRTAIIVYRAYLTGESCPVPAALVDRVDQEPVEHGQHQQRYAYERGYAKPVVRLLVDVVPAQFSAAPQELARRRVYSYVPLVRRAGRARNAEQSDHQDNALGPRLGAQHAAT